MTKLPAPQAGLDAMHYGECEPAGDAGCAPPLEIQSWSICDRFPAPPNVSRLTGLEGALVEVDPAEERTEVYTGGTAVVIFGHADLTRRAVRTLRPAGQEQASRELPPPKRPSLLDPTAGFRFVESGDG